VVQQRCSGGTIGMVKEKEKRRKKEKCGKLMTTMMTLAMAVVGMDLLRWSGGGIRRKKN